jgi:hypothetical protein
MSSSLSMSWTIPTAMSNAVLVAVLGTVRLVAPGEEIFWGQRAVRYRHTGGAGERRPAGRTQPSQRRCLRQEAMIVQLTVAGAG